MLRLGLRRGCLSRLGRGRELGTLRHQTRPHQSNAAHTNTRNMWLAIYSEEENWQQISGENDYFPICAGCLLALGGAWLTACDPSDCLRVLSLIRSQGVEGRGYHCVDIKTCPKMQRRGELSSMYLKCCTRLCPAQTRTKETFCPAKLFLDCVFCALCQANKLACYPSFCWNWSKFW